MNWYKYSKEKNKLDTQLLCCGYPENRRKDPYKPNKKKQKVTNPIVRSLGIGVLNTHAQRARYRGQLQGDENRPGSDSFQEALLDAEVAEGKYVKDLKALFKAQNFTAFEKYVNKLRAEGNSEHRIQSIVSKAMANIRF